MCARRGWGSFGRGLVARVGAVWRLEWREAAHREKDSRREVTESERKGNGKGGAHREKDSTFRLAPPTRAPSMSGHAIKSSTLASLTEPPYWIMTLSATSCE